MAASGRTDCGGRGREPGEQDPGDCTVQVGLDEGSSRCGLCTYYVPDTSLELFFTSAPQVGIVTPLSDGQGDDSPGTERPLPQTPQSLGATSHLPTANRPCRTCPVPSLPSPPPSPRLVHSAPATRASWLVPQLAQPSAAPGSLHVLCPLLGPALPRMRRVNDLLNF